MKRRAKFLLWGAVSTLFALAFLAAPFPVTAYIAVHPHHDEQFANGLPSNVFLALYNWWIPDLSKSNPYRVLFDDHMARLCAKIWSFVRMGHRFLSSSRISCSSFLFLGKGRKKYLLLQLLRSASLFSVAFIAASLSVFPPAANATSLECGPIEQELAQIETLAFGQRFEVFIYLPQKHGTATLDSVSVSYADEIEVPTDLLPGDDGKKIVNFVVSRGASEFGVIAIYREGACSYKMRQRFPGGGERYVRPAT